MVCVTITRDPILVNDTLACIIRDALHEAIVRAVNVKPKDVELRVCEVGPLDVNTPPLAVDIDSGAGKDSWRIAECTELLLRIDELVLPVVPEQFRAPGKSNIWLRIYAKAASMPFGCPEHLH